MKSWATDDRFVVLFTGKNCGMVVCNENIDTDNPVGQYARDWEETSFRIFQGEVNLTN